MTFLHEIDHDLIQHIGRCEIQKPVLMLKIKQIDKISKIDEMGNFIDMVKRNAKTTLFSGAIHI